MCREEQYGRKLLHGILPRENILITIYPGKLNIFYKRQFSGNS